MNALLRFTAAAIAVAGLSACAATQEMTSASPGAGIYEGPDRVVTDVAYIARVEHVARRRGVEVQWFNPPLKRVPNAQ